MGMFKQTNTGKSWGYIAQVASQVSILIAVVNLLLIAVTAYNTTLFPWLKIHGLSLPFWLFLTMLFVFMLISSLFLYKFAVPSFFSAFNDQFYKHDNPMRKDIDELKRVQEVILEKLNEDSINKSTSKH